MSPPVPTQPPLEDGPTVQPFAAFLQQWDAGVLHTRLTVLLPEPLEAVKAHERAGTLTLTLSAKPVKNSDQVELAAKVAVKVPEAEPRRRVVWVDDAGNPVTSDPRQMAFPTVAAVPRPEEKPIHRATGGPQ